MKFLSNSFSESLATEMLSVVLVIFRQNIFCSHSCSAKRTEVRISCVLVPLSAGNSLSDYLMQHLTCHMCLQCFDAVGWEAGRASGL